MVSVKPYLDEYGGKVVWILADGTPTQAQSFFEELHKIEKQAMLDGVSSLHESEGTVVKEALLTNAIARGRGLVSDVGLGLQRLSKKKGGEGVVKGLEDLGGVWRKGAETGGSLGGAGAVLGTKRGKALAALGLGGAALTATSPKRLGFAR